MVVWRNFAPKPTPMDSSKHPKDIIELIAVDLLLAQLEQGLHRLCIDTGPYSLSVSQAVFRLMAAEGTGQGQGLRDRYSALCRRALGAVPDALGAEAIERLARDVYRVLENEFGGMGTK